METYENISPRTSRIPPLLKCYWNDCINLLGRNRYQEPSDQTEEDIPRTLNGPEIRNNKHCTKYQRLTCKLEMYKVI